MQRYTYFPDYEALLDFQQELALQEHSYHEVGATRDTFPQGFNHDLNQVYLGTGPAVFERACAAMRRWEMFPPRWTRVFPANAPQEPGTNLVLLFQLFGLWWLNGNRIIYKIEDEKRYGFAYGTLVTHVEQGEEIFMIYRDDYDRVYYSISAFSRPRYWLAQLVYPFARFQQRRFIRQSLARMQRVARQQPVAGLVQ